MKKTHKNAVVELRVDGQIGGVKVRGWIDLLDAEGRVIDIKTAKARPSSIEAMHKFQVATYSRLTPGASGEGRIDTLVKTKTPQVISQNFRINVDERRAVETSTRRPRRRCVSSTTCRTDYP